ncbi:unnamed protein product [Ectocarpus sp. 4 AP-2014]
MISTMSDQPPATSPYPPRHVQTTCPSPADCALQPCRKYLRVGNIFVPSCARCCDMDRNVDLAAETVNGTVVYLGTRRSTFDGHGIIPPTANYLFKNLTTSTAHKLFVPSTPGRVRALSRARRGTL